MWKKGMEHSANVCFFAKWTNSFVILRACNWKILPIFAKRHIAMALNPDKNVKLYYSIKEVAKQFGINESTLRYWETEFPQLKPKTVTSTNVRQYTDADIEEIRVIYNLVRVRGFKLSAARKMLEANRKGAEKSSEVLETLLSVRDQLQELRKQLDMIVWGLSL